MIQRELCPLLIYIYLEHKMFLIQYISKLDTKYN